MKKHFPGCRTTRLGLAAATAFLGAGLALASGPASAQMPPPPTMTPQQAMPSEPAPAPGEAAPPQEAAPIEQALPSQPGEFVVTAPRVVRQTVGRSRIGAPIELVSIARQVRYADLDLTTESGAATLKDRVKETAADLCSELDKMYPLGPRDPDCVRKANKEAMAQVDRAIRFAQR